MNDTLHKYVQALLIKAKEKRNKGEVKFVWFKNNEILVRMVDGEKGFSIKSFNDLALFPNFLLNNGF